MLLIFLMSFLLWCVSTVSVSRTFEEAVLAVHHVDPSPLQAGGAVNLAVVLVEPAVRAAHGHEGGPAFLLADALGAPGLRHQDALSTPSAVGPPTGVPVWVREGWEDEKKRGEERHLFFMKEAAASEQVFDEIKWCCTSENLQSLLLGVTLKESKSRDRHRSHIYG